MEQKSKTKPTVYREPNRQRKYIRVKMPINIEIDGVKYLADDWSLGGMKILDIDPGVYRGDHLTATIKIPFVDFDFSFEVLCEIRNRNSDKRYLGCQFVDISEEQLNLLKYFIDAYISGKVASVDGVLKVDLENQLETETADKATAEDYGIKKTDRKRDIKKWLNISLLAAAGLIISILTVTAIYKRIFVVESRMAGVVAPVVKIRATGKGYMRGDRLKPGDIIPPGSVIARIVDQEIYNQLEMAKSDLSEEENRVVELNKRLKERESFFREYKILAGANLNRAEAEYREARENYSFYQGKYNRGKELHKQGVISNEEFERRLNTKQRMRERLLSKEAKLKEAQSNRRVADQNYYYTGTRVEGGEPGKIRMQIGIARGKLKNLRSRISTLQKQIDSQTVISKNSYEIVKVRHFPDEWVERGDVICEVVNSISDTSLVEALIDLDDAPGISIGQSVNVFIPSTDSFIEGEVTEIYCQEPNMRLTGLPDFRGPDKQFASVLIRIRKRDLRIGLPVKVKFTKSLESLT